VIGLAKLAPGPGNVSLAERPAREPERGQVALAVEAAGVCGTDLHIEAGEYPSAPPVTMGHEVCGTVAQVGEGVDADWLGARVVCETYYSTCGHCASCRDGRRNLCLERRSIGTHVDGGFAPRLVLPAANLHRVPEGCDVVAASLSEPLACVCHALLDPPLVSAGDPVLVIGPGAIGLLAAQVARSGGGRVSIQGTPRDEARLELAAALGFETLVAGAARPAGFEEPAVVVECSGAAPGIADALRSARRGGRLVQIGLRGAEVTLPWDLICFHELTVTSGFASTPESWRRALALIGSGSVELAALVSEVVPLGEWERAFAASREGRGVKYVLDPSGAAP
jgi:L-iditol 2-dehydrogenase